MKREILALFFLACCAPLLAVADNAAQTRAKKAAEYRDNKEAVAQPALPPETDGTRQDAPKEQQPQNQGKSLENMLEGLLKPGEPR